MEQEMPVFKKITFLSYESNLKKVLMIKDVSNHLKSNSFVKFKNMQIRNASVIGYQFMYLGMIIVKTINSVRPKVSSINIIISL